MHDCVWMHGVFIVWNLLEDMAQLQPWPHSLAYSYEVKDVCVGLNLCSKTVSWADVLFAYSYTATALMVVWWLYCILYVQVSAELLEVLWNKITTCMWHNFLCNPYSEKWLYMLVLNCLPINSLSFWWLKMCCDNLQCNDNAYCILKTCLLQIFPIVSLISHGEWFILLVMSAEKQDL